MVKIYKLKFTILQLELQRYLFIRAGEFFNARTLAKALEVSSPAIAKSLPALKKEELIKVNKVAGRLSIELNRDNLRVISMKRAENLKLLYESGLVKFLYDALPGATIILFGSFASGDDTFSSDIDLAIIGVKEKNLNLANYQKMLEKSINLNYYPSLSLEKHLKNNLLNGIVLKGSIEL